MKQTRPVSVKPATQTQLSTQVNLYASPMPKSKVVTSVPVNQSMVPFYKQGRWIKVGLRKDGQVGWIYRPEYRQALRAWYTPKQRVTFIQTERVVQNGKTVTKVVAYRDGKKLNDKQAKKMYKTLQKNQMKAINRMMRMESRMDRMFFSRMRSTMGASMLNPISPDGTSSGAVLPAKPAKPLKPAKPAELHDPA